MNTITPQEILVFNKACNIDKWINSAKPEWLYFNLIIDELEWVSIDNMTEEQKKDNPTYHVTDGFLLLKKSEYNKEEVYKKSALASWNNATHEDRMLTYQLPNFDAEIAEEIFGIDFAGYLLEYKQSNKTNKYYNEELINDICNRIKENLLKR
jgi:hypothetical protein